MAEYYVYRYVNQIDGKIIYVGKTDASLKQRIDAHEKEIKFLPFVGLWKVEYIELSNSVETDFIEKYFINLWKPILNDKDKVEGISLDIQLTIPEWHSYSDYLKKEQATQYDYLLKTAWKNQELLDALTDAYYEKHNTFQLPFIQNGDLSFPENLSMITKNVIHPEIIMINHQYQYQLSETMDYSFLEKYPNILYCEIWKEIALLQKIPEIQYYMNTVNFMNILADFQLNGYVQYDGMDRGYLFLKEKDWDTLQQLPANRLCCDIQKMYDIYVVEFQINEIPLFPNILEQVAKQCKTIIKAQIGDRKHYEKHIANY